MAASAHASARVGLAVVCSLSLWLGIGAGCSPPTNPGPDTGPQCSVHAESACNGRDDDGDGIVDDGCPCTFRANSEGVCANATINCNGKCRPPGSWESDETTCDGKDNDCDGQTDESFPKLGDRCDTDDTDECKLGTYVCKDNGTGVVCGPESKTDLVEKCDTKDNDCDGQTDETCMCHYKGKKAGVCEARVEMNDSCPEPDAYESPESSCDGKDNDCNGWIDGWHLGCPGYVGLFASPDEDIGWDAATDDENNVYTVGWTEGPSFRGGREGFWRKFDRTGEQTGSTLFGGDDTDNIYSISVHSDSVYVGGETFGPIAGQRYAGGNQADGDIAVFRFDTDGNRKWVRLLGSPDGDQGEDIGVDSMGNVYVAGETVGAIRGTNAGEKDAVVAKYGPNGNQKWVDQFGTSADDEIEGIHVTDGGDVFAVGFTDGDIGDNSNAGGHDIFIAKYDSDGNRPWIETVANAADEYAYDIAGGANNSLYIAAEVEDSVAGETYLGGGGDAMIVKLDRSGTRQWTRLLGSADLDYATAVSVGPNGGVFVSGNTEGGLEGRTPAGEADAFAAEFSPSGQLKWVELFGTGETEDVAGMDVLPSGRPVVAGESGGAIGEGAGSNNSDAFVAW